MTMRKLRKTSQLLSLRTARKRAEQNHLAPWQFKNGQSGNPLGRAPGKSMKEFAKEYLSSLTDEERLAYFEGMNKADIWKMAEANPANTTALTGKDGGPIQIEGGRNLI